MGSGNESANVNLPLFETRVARGGAAHKLLCFTVIIGMVIIWAYRLIHIPRTGMCYWIGMLFAEIFLGFYWIITQSSRFGVVYHCPFKDRLAARYDEKLPKVDIFVCTADPILEPASMVMSTVLSVMSYNYPPEKISVYLSDDGGSKLTFYALLEASKFSKHWIPFSKKYNIEPRSPQVYFSHQNAITDHESSFAREWTNVKELYEDMISRIDSVAAKGYVPKEITDQHKGFSEWNSKVTKQDHQSIIQILVDAYDPKAVDVKGNRMPTLVYLSREKKPGWPHHFKAGSMNALLRVSEKISNAPIILNVDCDMYANDPDAIQDALCFFLDEKEGQKISYVQYPQQYNNLVKNDIYANANRATIEIELCGLDGFGGAIYCGTGCFHRRESLSGNKYSGNHRIESLDDNVQDNRNGLTVEELEETSKALANCSYENGTLWGKEMGLVYGCPAEDVVTGFTIQCRGWKPAYYNPKKCAFLGVAPTTLDVSLVQFKRWAEGMFQVFFSKYCPFIYGHGKIAFGAQLGYCTFVLWAATSLPTLCYVVVPALSLLHDVPVFPKVSSLWFIPFTYIFVAKTAHTIVELLQIGGTLREWWNLQRMVLIRRITSYLFGFLDTVIRQLGLSQTTFAVTAKVEDDEARTRYEKGIIEFGSSSIMSIIIATLALINLFSVGWGIKKVFFSISEEFEKFIGQFTICGMIVMLNLPVYEALFFRSDKGKIPSSVALKSIVIASLACLIPIY